MAGSPDTSISSLDITDDDASGRIAAYTTDESDKRQAIRALLHKHAESVLLQKQYELNPRRSKSMDSGEPGGTGSRTAAAPPGLTVRDGRPSEVQQSPPQNATTD